MRYTYYNKWATPILVCQNEEHSEIYDTLIAEINQWDDGVEILDGLQTSRGEEDRVGKMFKRGLYESSFYFFQEAEQKGCHGVLGLRDWMIDSFAKVFYNYFAEEGNYFENTVSHFVELDIKRDDIRVEIPESWMHVTKDGGYHGTHNHPMHSWGVIYYVEIGDSTKSNGNNLFYSGIPAMYQEFGNFWQQFDVFSLEPQNGMMIAFPAHILHSANVYRTDGVDRIVIAGNLKVHCDKWGIGGLK
jgi:hypothetical protein